MRILYWTESFWPRIGGSEVAAWTLIDQLRSRGHAFEVVTRQWSPDHPKTDDWEGIPVHRVPFDDGTFDRLDLQEILPLRQRIVAIKRKFKPHLVHIGLTGPSLFLNNFTNGQFPAPTLITLHVVPGENEYGRNRPVHEALLAASNVVGVSNATAKRIKDRLPQLVDRCSVIYNALPEPSSLLTAVPFSPPRLLCVGRVTQQKGFDTAIAAMPIVCESFPDAELVIAGDGDASESLGELAKQLNVANCVRMIGWTPADSVNRLIDSATMVLMPSRWEPFGLVALQAGQRGRPCLASNVDGLPEVVQHEQTGLLLPPDEPGQWADAICSLLRDRPHTAKLGEQARQFVSNQFNLERHVDAYEALYHELNATHSRLEALV